MSRRKVRKLRSVPKGEIRKMTADEMANTEPLPGMEISVPLQDREGVYVHSFKCLRCSLHFMTFSWQADRHHADSIHCPECGTIGGPYMHHRAIVSESRSFGLQTDNEIFGLHPWPGSLPVEYESEEEA